MLCSAKNQIVRAFGKLKGTVPIAVYSWIILRTFCKKNSDFREKKKILALLDLVIPWATCKIDFDIRSIDAEDLLFKCGFLSFIY